MLGLGCRAEDVEYRVHGEVYRVQGSGLRVKSVGCGV